MKPPRQTLVEFFRVDGIVLVALLGDQGVASRIAGDDAFGIVQQATIDPLGQLAFLEDDVPRAADALDDLAQGGQRGWRSAASRRFAAGRADEKLGALAMRVH